MNMMEEMMVNLLSKMTGLSPEQMQVLAEQAIALLQSMDSRLTNMEKGIAIIHKTMGISEWPVESDKILPTLEAPVSLEVV